MDKRNQSNLTTRFEAWINEKIVIKMWKIGRESKSGEKNKEYHLNYNNLRMTGIYAERVKTTFKKRT